MPYECPHCEETIDYLTYNTSGYEYGDYNPATGNYDYNDSNHEGDTTYYCPECNEEIENPDEMEQISDDKEKEKSESESKLNRIALILKPKEYDDKGLVIKEKNQNISNIIQCRCGFAYDFSLNHYREIEEKVAECSICGKNIRNPKYKS